MKLPAATSGGNSPKPDVGEVTQPKKRNFLVWDFCSAIVLLPCPPSLLIHADLLLVWMGNIASVWLIQCTQQLQKPLCKETFY